MADDQGANPGKEAVLEGQHPIILRVLHSNSSVDHNSHLDFTTPIKFLKAEVDSDINPHSIPLQVWIHKGIELEDGKTIGDYRIVPESVIEVELRANPLQN